MIRLPGEEPVIIDYLKDPPTPGASVCRRRKSSAASLNSQSRNVVILGSIDVALGQTIQ